MNPLVTFECGDVTVVISPTAQFLRRPSSAAAGPDQWVRVVSGVARGLAGLMTSAAHYRAGNNVEQTPGEVTPAAGIGAGPDPSGGSSETPDAPK